MNQHNALDVVALIFTHFLRHGFCSEGTELSEVLRMTAKRPDRTVQLMHHQLPLLPHSKRNHLDISYPATTVQISDTVSQLALDAGIVPQVTSHDIRRGAFRDLAYSSHAADNQGLATERVSSIAGHRVGKTRPRKEVHRASNRKQFLATSTRSEHRASSSGGYRKHTSERLHRYIGPRRVIRNSCRSIQ